MEKEKKKIVVFLVDDISEDRIFLKKSFKEAGINARVFSFDCESKLMNLLAGSSVYPDVIFLSFNLKSESAKSCLKRIKLKRQFANTPIIIFSLSTYLNDIDEAFESGASLFIPKHVLQMNRTKTLQKIFSCTWRKDLLKPNKTKFVLNVISEVTKELKWSAS